MPAEAAVRLGEGEFVDNEILPDATERAINVCKKFTALARTFDAEEFVAVATSATREARNQNELLQRLRHETMLDVRVISGLEEARLIYLGVAGAVNLGDQEAVFIDIGGEAPRLQSGGGTTVPFT